MDDIHDDLKKGEKWAAHLWSREAVILTALASLAIMFAVTKVAVSFYSNKQSQLAKMWFQRGNQALVASQPKRAVEDIRNALSYDPSNAAYQLRIAQALAAANRIDEAEGYLLDLWDKQPGSGEINLELAELEARKGNVDAARYYDNAIYGVWEKNPVDQRRRARLALFHYWVSRGNMGQAQAELLALAADTPDVDFRRRTEIGQLQLQANAPRQALDQFRQALRVSPRYAPALAGAGSAEVATGEYQNAIPYLAEAVRLSPSNQEAVKQLRLARQVLASDPFQIGISEKQRMGRTLDAFLQAQSTLARCATQHNVTIAAQTPSNPFQKIWAQGQTLLPFVSKLRGNPQNDLKLMNFAFSAENLAATECGPLEGKDQALWLIGKKHRLAEASGQGGK